MNPGSVSDFLMPDSLFYFFYVEMEMAGIYMFPKITVPI